MEGNPLSKDIARLEIQVGNANESTVEVPSPFSGIRRKLRRLLQEQDCTDSRDGVRFAERRDAGIARLEVRSRLTVSNEFKRERKAHG
jgi:hypothetical protein